MSERCCICEKNIEREDAPILTLGGAGYARLLCDECDEQLNTITTGRDAHKIKEAINSLGNKMANTDPDPVTYQTVSTMLFKATERGMAIKEGTYDFALDEEVEDTEGFDEIPEELLETEEDIQKDKDDEEKMKKFDKFYNIALIVCGIVFVGLVIYNLFFKK